MGRVPLGPACRGWDSWTVSRRAPHQGYPTATARPRGNQARNLPRRRFQPSAPSRQPRTKGTARGRRNDTKPGSAAASPHQRPRCPHGPPGRPAHRTQPSLAAAANSASQHGVQSAALPAPASLAPGPASLKHASLPGAKARRRSQPCQREKDRGNGPGKASAPIYPGRAPLSNPGLGGPESGVRKTLVMISRKPDSKLTGFSACVQTRTTAILFLIMQDQDNT